jgi:hypothetical protein
MIITKVTVGITKNTGNYESLRLDLTADIGPNETHEMVYEFLRQELNNLANKTIKHDTSRIFR